MTALDLSVPYICVYPEQATEGSLGTLAAETRLAHLMELQSQQLLRDWTVRGVPSDHIPLTGSGALGAVPQHRFYLNENPLRIYLHFGGRKAVYFELVADSDSLLQYISVVVQTRLPSNALLLARQPLNALLDVFARARQQPLVYQRLDLISPVDGLPVAHELVLPFSVGVKFGPLGGFDQVEAFARYDAILREAITSGSPFYQFLCAYRLYEGTNVVRRWLRLLAKRFNVQAPLPHDPAVDSAALVRMGFAPEVAQGIRTVSDLWERLRPSRDAIAHFLLKQKGSSSHVYLSDGTAIHHYSISAAVLLRYSRATLDELKQYYTRHLDTNLRRGSIFPLEEQRDRYKIVDATERQAE